MELRFLTRLQRTTALVTPCPRPRLVRSTLEHPIQAPVIAGKEHGTAADKAFFARLTNRDLVLYSDGSKREYELPNSSGKAVGTGWGFVAFQGDQQLYAAYGRLSEAEVFDAEATGAAQAALWAPQRLANHMADRVHFCLDNAAGKHLQGLTTLGVRAHSTSNHTNLDSGFRCQGLSNLFVRPRT